MSHLERTRRTEFLAPGFVGRLTRERTRVTPASEATPTNGETSSAPGIVAHSRRRKSRSPEPNGGRASNHTRGSGATRGDSTSVHIKKKRTGSSVAQSMHIHGQSGSLADSMGLGGSSTVIPGALFSVEEVPLMDRKGKKSGMGKEGLTSSARGAENASQISGTGYHRGTLSSLRKERERSKSRDTQRVPKPTLNHIVSNTGAEALTKDTHADELSGPIAAAELQRMKKEIELLKKAAHDSKKTIKKQRKEIEKMEQEVVEKANVVMETNIQLEKLRTKSQKTDEVISTVESSLQCQICIDLLSKPHALAPCGHILCQLCLQEWFRKAPVTEDEMYDDDDPDYLLYRQKSCPCCRTVVRGRPVPVFLIKALTVALSKARAPQSPSAQSETPVPVGDDPWEGLFFKNDTDGSVEEEIYEDFDDDDEESGLDVDVGEDSDVDIDGSDGEDWGTAIFTYGSEPGDAHYDGPFVPAQWEPASVSVSRHDYDLGDATAEEMNVIRRGATPAMIQLFQMRYSHDTGLSARHRHGENQEKVLYLGWNIDLSADDVDGSRYMDWAVDDVARRPDRWEIISRWGDGNGERGYSARRLVPEDEVRYEYTTTNSEFYDDRSEEEW